MPLSHPLPEPIVELVAKRFRVIGEPMRIRILERLRDGAASVGELVESVGASQQNVSKHLGVLHDAGVVRRSRDGNRVVYTITDATVFTLCEIVCTGIARQASELAMLADAAQPIATNRRRQPAGHI